MARYQAISDGIQASSNPNMLFGVWSAMLGYAYKWAADVGGHCACDNLTAPFSCSPAAKTIQLLAGCHTRRLAHRRRHLRRLAVAHADVGHAAVHPEHRGAHEAGRRPLLDWDRGWDPQERFSGPQKHIYGTCRKL
jgi:hypothetical protein